MRPAELRRRFLDRFAESCVLCGQSCLALCSFNWRSDLSSDSLERWPVGDLVYFTFVTGLTIGYGDLVPARLVARLIALMIGFIGILLTGLVAAGWACAHCRRQRATRQGDDRP